MAVKIFGAFECLVVLLIIVGDGLGGLLYVLSVAGEIGFLLWARHTKNKLASWSNHDLTEVPIC